MHTMTPSVPRPGTELAREGSGSGGRCSNIPEGRPTLIGESGTYLACVRRIRAGVWGVALCGAWLVAGCATSRGPRHANAPEPFAPALTTAMAVQQVRVAELAFAKSMADRDFTAFMSHVSPNAVFFGGKGVEHGPTEIAAAWRPLFNDFEAPFSWAPDAIEVLPTGDLAFSTGPVVIKGKVVGRYNSIWRLEAPNTWRIVFDKGENVCEAH